MTNLPKVKRLVKPAVCESIVICEPIAPCELRAEGIPGLLEINGTIYSVDILGYLPDDGVSEPVVDGYRLTKADGTAHDVCNVAGRLECSCGDWLFRRSFQNDRTLADCKHTAACQRHFASPVDQRAAVA